MDKQQTAVQDSSTTPTTESIDQKVEALRGELRNGRRSHKASEGSERHGTGANEQTGPGIQAARRNNAAAKGNRSTSSGDKRSPQEESERVGSSSRRPGNNGGSPSDGNQQATDGVRASVGSIERIDELTERIDNDLPVKSSVTGYKEDYRRRNAFGRGISYHLKTDSSKRITAEEWALLPSRAGSPPSIASAPPLSEKFNFFGKGPVLSAKEAEELREPLIAALIDYGGYADRFIRMQAKEPDLPDIWGDMTELEAGVLARIMIRRGQKNAAAAGVVRTMANSNDYISAAIIVVPRVIRTAETLTAQRKARKVKAVP